MELRRTVSALVTLFVSAPSSSFAFTVDTRVSEGCHERMSLLALRNAGWPGAETAPALDEYGRRILDDLPFLVPNEAHDSWSLALLIGVRDNDLHGVAPSDLPGLSHIHNDPALQSEHCLRGPFDDGPEGDASALSECRSFILEELANALGPGDRIDLEATVAVEVNLAFRGEIEIEVQRFAFHVGRALHALQDSYSHSFRTSTDERVRHVLNFVDPARESDYSVARDGHEHIAALDDCTDAANAERVRAAEVASTRLLSAVMNEEGGRPGRIARVQAVLDLVLSHQGGCTEANSWCDAPELSLLESCACRGPPKQRSTPLLGFSLLALLVFGRRMNRRRLFAAAFLVSFLVGKPASATGTSTVPLDRLGIHLAGSAAIDRGAFAIALGLRWRALDDLTLGIDLEHNPWFSIDAAEIAPGAVNIYATGVYHWATFEDLELRSTVHAGTSILLFDLVGAEAGSAGLYFGLSLLGLAVRLGEQLQLIFEPADLAFPIPHLTGVPFYYRQYRVTLGLQWNP